MKIIEGLKKLKYLEKKLDDLKEKIRRFCCDMDYETPAYPDQKEQIESWIQSYKDVLKEISNISYRLHKTNIETKVKIELDGKIVEKSIAEWILRRRKLITMETNLYTLLTDRGLKEGPVQFPSGNILNAKIRRYYDIKEKDRKLTSLSNEPFEIDSKLEIVNAITDLIE